MSLTVRSSGTVFGSSRRSPVASDWQFAQLQRIRSSRAPHTSSSPSSHTNRTSRFPRPMISSGMGMVPLLPPGGRWARGRSAGMLPGPIEDLVDALACMPGAVAVVLGGSRAAGAADPTSDWDLGVYYRGALDTAALAARGTVHPPGAWGRIMNGGAWLTVGGAKVDVLLRDLDVVDHWCALAVEEIGRAH